MIRVLFMMLALCLPARAEQVVADLSQNQVAITAFFEGSEIFIFGAVQRDAPVPSGVGPLQVMISIVGPSAPVTVRRKEQIAGIWMNRDAVEVQSAPHFYANASTISLPEMISVEDQLVHQIGLEYLVRMISPSEDITGLNEFRRAVIRQRQQAGLYKELPGAVRLIDETLFSAAVRLPANLVEGDYRARVFLTRDTAVIDTFETVISVRKSGVEQAINSLALNHPLIYGLLTLAMALFAGWAASGIVRMIRG